MLLELTTPALKTDKENSKLFDFYEKIIPQNIDSLIEIGVWNCGALLAYARYFKNARCMGIDRENPSDYIIKIIRDHDIKNPVLFTLCDQSNSLKMAEVCKREYPAGIDVIIDDASHLYELTKMTFYALWPLIKPGGIYIIEDWQASYCHEKFKKDGGPAKLLHKVIDLMQTEKRDIEEIRIVKRGFALFKRRAE